MTSERLLNREHSLAGGRDVWRDRPAAVAEHLPAFRTAVALLFSIYQVKPSPFCVLDELDAPLDESNINRLIRVLKRFIEHSQFIIITHNERTIGMADVLYGITMQEHGVSKVVSVKFHKAEETVTDHTPDPLVPPAPGPQVEEEEDKLHSREDTVEVVMAK